MHNSSISRSVGWFLAAVLLLAPTTSQAADFGVSLKAGANWSLLSRPTDPEGTPTLLSGSAFDGTGFGAGASAHYTLTEFEGAVFELEAGILYSHHSATGFEQRSDSDARRTVTLTSDMLRVPVLLHLRSGKGTGFRLGAGIEPMFGLKSGATVAIEGASEQVEPLHTTPTTHLGWTWMLAFDWRATPEFLVPVELRATWDPSVAESTLDRFEGYTSMDEPGNYRVAFNWQLMFMTGIRYDL